MSKLERIVLKRRRRGKEPEDYEILAGRVNGCYYLQTTPQPRSMTGKVRGTYYPRQDALERDLTKVVRSRLARGYTLRYTGGRRY